ELTDVPVQFLCPPGFAYRPQFANDRAGQVTLRVQGPVQDEPPKVTAYIDLTRGRFTAGNNHEPLQIQLPKDFQLAQEPPRTVAVTPPPARARANGGRPAALVAPSLGPARPPGGLRPAAKQPRFETHHGPCRLLHRPGPPRPGRFAHPGHGPDGGEGRLAPPV